MAQWADLVKMLQVVGGDIGESQHTIFHNFFFFYLTRLLSLSVDGLFKRGSPRLVSSTVQYNVGVQAFTEQ